MDQKTGTVKWWSSEKGFGFINPDDGTEAVFVHYTTLVGCNDLMEGERVTYSLGALGTGHPQAVGVRVSGSF